MCRCRYAHIVQTCLRHVVAPPTVKSYIVKSAPVNLSNAHPCDIITFDQYMQMSE